MNASLNPLLVLLAILAAAATTGLAAPVDRHTNLHHNSRHLHARQTDNYRQAVAGPVGAAELAWVFGALFATWALIVIGILILRKRRKDELEEEEEEESMQGQEVDGKEWADT